MEKLLEEVGFFSGPAHSMCRRVRVRWVIIFVVLVLDNVKTQFNCLDRDPF